MDWKALGQAVAKIGLPILGAALPLPGGAALGAALAGAIGSDSAKPEDILTALTANADSVAKAKQFEQQHEETMLKMQIDAEVASIQAVNATMQAEAKSDHWPTYTWRPFIGFMFGCYLASMWLLPLFHGQPVTLSPDLTLTIGGILGIASYFRGKMQADPNVKTDNRG
jgi:hypothetical protein